MTGDHEVLERVRAMFRSEPRIHAVGAPIRLSLSGGDLIVEGTVDRIAGKKLALRAAAVASGAGRIVDRLHVAPATPMGDGEIRDHLRRTLIEEQVLADCAIREWLKGRLESARELPAATGAIEIRVQGGVVTLDGEVAGLGQKRLAGVLAWWVPGSRDVINGLGVEPPEPDTDDAITDAVRQALEKAPLVDASAVEVGTRSRIVTLIGSVPDDAQRRLAEADAWYVFGIDDVRNHLDVAPG
jgi:osmotically-inducible protein OsmY